MAVGLALLALLWVARYWHSGAFGLYEDDLTRIPMAVQMPLADLLASVWHYILRLYGQGRPLHGSFVLLLSHIGWRLLGLRGPYLIGFALVSANALLFYALVRRLYDGAFAVLSALAFVLFSADTTQAFLTHSLGLHPSLLFFLLGCHAYLSGRRWLTYLMAVLVLFTYETPFPMFLALPLLSRGRNRRLLQNILVNSLILGAMLVLDLLLRISVGDRRVSGLGFPDILTVPVVHMLQGPVVSLGTYLYRPYQTLRQATAEAMLTSVVAWPVLGWWISTLSPEGVDRFGALLRKRQSRGLRPVREIAQGGVRDFWADPTFRRLVRVGLAGFALLVLAYPLTFTVRAHAITGRDTRVHFAAVVGAALVWGTVSYVFLMVTHVAGRRHLGAILLGAIFGLLVGFGMLVQRDYRLGWQYQQQFWTQLVRLIPDVEEGTVILVDPRGLPDSRQIGANTWNLPRVLDQIYHFPDEWTEPPRVYRLVPGWQERLITSEGRFRVDAATVIAPPDHYKQVEPGAVIFIETVAGVLRRRREPLVLNGETYPIKYTDALGPPPYPPAFLHRYLILDGGIP